MTRSLGDHRPNAEADAEMLIGTSIQPQRSGSDTALSVFRMLLMVLLLAWGTTHSLAQQTDVTPSKSRQSPTAPSPFAHAEQLFRQGSVEQAKQEIQEQLALHPNSVAGYNLLGIVYSSEKNYADAAQAFDHALKLSPNSSKTHNNLGNLYVAQNKTDLAEKEFRTAVRLDPADRDGNYNLGLLLMAKGSPAEAIVYFQRVHPANMETKFNLVRCYLQSGREAAGLSLAKTLSAENKDNVQLHFTLGVVLASAKHYREAEIEFEKANALRPEMFETLYNLGHAYLRDRQFGKAELALNRALKVKPDSPDTLYLLGQVYADQTRPVDALDVLVRAHKLAPEDTDIIFLLAHVSMNQNYFEEHLVSEGDICHQPLSTHKS